MEKKKKAYEEASVKMVEFDFSKTIAGSTEPDGLGCGEGDPDGIGWCE